VAMTLQEALDVLAKHRGKRVVIPTMASVSVWPQLSDTPLDFAYMPSAMGQGPALDWDSPWLDPSTAPSSSTATAPCS